MYFQVMVRGYRDSSSDLPCTEQPLYQLTYGSGAPAWRNIKEQTVQYKVNEMFIFKYTNKIKRQ